MKRFVPIKKSMENAQIQNVGKEGLNGLHLKIHFSSNIQMALNPFPTLTNSVFAALL